MCSASWFLSVYLRASIEVSNNEHYVTLHNAPRILLPDMELFLSKRQK